MGSGKRVARAVVLLLTAALATGCTGGKETSAAEEPAPVREAARSDAATFDARNRIATISKSIPLYAGAQYREDLSRRDAVMVESQYGPGSQVYTLATNDSFPQVYHYYTTYLAQYRAYPAQNPYPPEQQNWRTLEVQLNAAMQDPFIPGSELKSSRGVVLQVAETEAEPKTVIRYIVTPMPPQVAAAGTATVTAEAR
jgi:hypothetical protein